ncbi:MAG: Spi family protease inhibitor, partial [Bacteroidetes bacterium]|nr:Spi family protease inhibitor [Candidatus Merdivivens pullicola]
MKKYLLILMSFVLIMAASCTKETMTENPDRKSVGTEASNKTKALDYLDRLLEDLYGETKSGIPEYNPDNVEALTAGQICPTKSNTVPRIDNSDDTLLYIVNFNNNNGYAVLSAMTSAKNPVFCVTESGCIT